MMRQLFLLFLLLNISDASSVTNACASFENGACVCTASQCDFIEGENLEELGNNEGVIFYSHAKSEKRLTRSTFNISTKTSPLPSPPPKSSIIISSPSSPPSLDQKIIGFGGAFTDAATINLYKSSNGLKRQLLSSYFGNGGIDYTLGRIPIAACDFSDHEYSYNDVENDFEMKNFSIDEDRESGRLDFIRAALNLTQATTNANISLFASSWSPPAWMKTNKKRIGGKMIGSAGDAYHQSYADYLVKFVSAFNSENIKIWGMTVQNEPTATVPWDSCHFTAEEERDFVLKDLGPKMRASHPDVKLLMFDDQFPNLPKWDEVILQNSSLAPYVDGVAFHWYSEFDLEINWYSKVSDVRKRHPSLLYLPSEACEGYIPGRMQPKLGDWTRGKRYAHDIIQDLLHGACGWTDWNLYLNMRGGPNHANNNVDAPIIVDYDNDRFYKQPMYYVMGHFSKFIRPDFERVNVQTDLSHVETVTFIDPERSKLVIVLLNQKLWEKETVTIFVKANESDESVDEITVEMEAESMATLVVPLRK